jgi:hypothetical protein
MIINSIEDIIYNLENDILTPSQAVEVACRSLNIPRVAIDGATRTKEEIKSELIRLLNYKEMPLFWGTTPTYIKPFSIKEIYK